MSEGSGGEVVERERDLVKTGVERESGRRVTRVRE